MRIRSNFAERGRKASRDTVLEKKNAVAFVSSFEQLKALFDEK